MSLTVFCPNDTHIPNYEPQYIFFPLKNPLPQPDDPNFYLNVLACFQDLSYCPKVTSFDELASLGRANLNTRLNEWRSVLAELNLQLQNFHLIPGTTEKQHQDLQERQRFATLSIDTITRARATIEEDRPFIAHWRPLRRYVTHDGAAAFLVTRLSDYFDNSNAPSTYPHLTIRCHAYYVGRQRQFIRCEPYFVQHDPEPHPSITSSYDSPFLFKRKDYLYLKEHADYRQLWLSTVTSLDAKVLETVFARGITI